VQSSQCTVITHKVHSSYHVRQSSLQSSVTPCFHWHSLSIITLNMQSTPFHRIIGTQQFERNGIAITVTQRLSQPSQALLPAPGKTVIAGVCA
jgi:hypothetical protein